MRLRVSRVIFALCVAVPATAQVAYPDETGFQTWLAQYRARALRRGLPAVALDEVTAGLTLNPRVIELDRAQPDDSARVQPKLGDYLDRHVTAERVRRGQALAHRIRPALDRATRRTGVPAGIILAIWGMETNYGAFTGGFDLPRALATLAYEGRRRALFEGELDASVRLVAAGTARASLKGSWAGATGQPQFLPSSVATIAADGDDDGVADIWSNPADVAASIGHYLQLKGWDRARGWGFPVTVPAGLERWRVRDLVRAKTCARVLAKHSRWLSAAEWQRLGLIAEAWPAPDRLLALVEPDGPAGPAYLTSGNYRAILAYNCSNFYAISVGALADRLR